MYENKLKINEEDFNRNRFTLDNQLKDLNIRESGLDKYKEEIDKYSIKLSNKEQ